MNNLKVTLGIALAMAMSGCGLARVYNKVELGQPLPRDLGLIERERGSASTAKEKPPTRTFGRTEYYVWHTPLTISVHSTGFTVDANDKVTAKSLERVSICHLLLCTYATGDTSVEITIPPSLLAQPEGVRLKDVFDAVGGWPEGASSPENDAAWEALLWPLPITYPKFFILAAQTRRTMKYVDSIPLARLVSPGYKETTWVKTGAFVTLTHRGDGRLGIHVHVALFSDALNIIPALILNSGGPSTEVDAAPEEAE